MTSTAISPVTDLISTCNNLISSLSSPPSEHTSQPTIVSIYTTIFDTLDQLFTLYTQNGLPLNDLEAINHIPLDQLISILNQSMQSTETQDFTIENNKKDLGLMLARLSKCAKNYTLFKVIFPSTTALKLMSIFFQIWKVIPNDQLGVDSVINLIGLLFYRNKDLTESFTEAICSFIQELVLDVKPKSPKQHYSFVLELVLTVMKNMTVQGLDFSQDLGNQGYVTQTLIQNLKGVEKFMDKFIEFLLERYENSKHSGFKQLLKICCEGLFQQLTDPSTSMSSKLGFKLLERFCAILKTNYYTMPHKVFYADLILSFFKRNLKSFYNITQTMQYLFIYATNKQVKSANKSSRFCSICAPNEIRKGNESPDGICESCEFLLEHLDLTKNKKNSKHSMFQNFQSIIHLEHLLDFKGLTFTLLQHRTTMHSSQKNNIPSMFSFNSDDVAKYLNENELYDRLVVFLKQVEIDDNMQLSNKMLEDLYILNSIPQFSKVLSNFLELCIILSNENSCTLRLKAIDFLNEMAKSCPEAMLNDENLMTTLKHRMLDVSSHARLNALEVFLYLIRRNFDSKSEAFQLVLSRANDIFPAFRKAVVTFILDTLVVEEETLSNDPALLQQLFEVLARKTCDKEDIAATSFTGLLHIMFPSFKPNSQTLKKLECKLFTGSSKKSSKKSNNGDEEAHFEKNLRLLRSSFESLGQEWYYKMLSEASKIGTIDSNEIVSFIGFLLSKVHKTQENKNFLFSLLKPFSENFPSQFVPELTYFQVYLSEYNKAKLSSEHREERKAVRQVCEILQNVMTYHSESFTASQLKKFSTLEREFLEIVYNDSQMLVSAAMKTLSFSTKKLTRDFQLINQEFFKCYNLFLSHFNIYANSSRNPSMNKSAVMMQDEKSQELPERQDIRQILPSLIRSAYIIAYIIKFLGTEHLSPVLYAINMSEDEMVNGLYAKFSSFIDMQHGVIELNQAGIECVAALWEYKPLLALKSKDLLRQFLASVPTNEVMKAMQIQTLSVFHSILLEYRQENQRSLQSLDDKFRDYMASAKKNLPPKSPASWERRTSSTTARSAKKPAERSSVVQLISECMSLVVPHVYESDSNVKLLITRVVLLMMQEGHCHVHTVFPKIFALIGDDNEDVRACCLAIVENAMAKNATIVSFELENSLIEAQAFEQKYKTSTVLYVENSEQEKISTYEKVYENSLRHGSDNEMVLRTCLDAVSTLVLTTGNNYNIMQFLCEFVSSLPRIKIDHLLKTLGSLRTHIEKTYHKVIKLLKPIAKSSQKSEENVQDKEESQSPEVSQGLSEAENNQSVVEKHKNTIFSLFISLVYTNLLTKITKETSNGKKISGNLNEDSISTCIEHIQRKLTTEGDKNSFAKIEFNYDTLTAVRTALRQYFELNYHMDQNVKDLYKTIKGLYKGKTECMELFESIGIVSVNEEEVNNKKSMSKKKKVVQKTVHETPKKGKIKVVIKRNTTAAKKNKKTDIDDDDTARKEWEEYEPAFTKEVVFNTEYKTKLRKKKRNQFGDPLQEIY